MDKLPKDTVAQFNTLKTKLRSIEPKIKAITEQGQAITEDPSKLFLFKGMHRRLDQYFDEFNSTWDQLIAFTFLHEIPKAFPSDNDTKSRSSVEELYYEASAIYELHMHPTPAVETQTLGLNTAMNESRILRSRLPEINLPRFDGTYADWPLFRDTYVSLIHNEPTLSSIEKFHFLLSSLTGPALSLVKGVSLTQQNYAQAWKVLKDNYDDHRRLANSYLKSVVNFVPFRSKPTAASLKYFLTTVIEAITSFRQLAIPNSEEFLLLFLVLRCLDSQTRKEFERKHATEEFPSYDSLVSFLRAELRSLELTSDELPAAPENKPQGSNTPQFSPLSKQMRPRNVVLAGCSSSDDPGNGSGFRNDNAQLNRKQSSPGCPVCKSYHTLYHCYKFKSATPQERLRYLKNWHGCINCLSSRHKLQSCPSSRLCQTCQQNHHSWLHVGDSNQPQGAKACPTDQGNPGDSVALSGTAAAGDVILGTALAKIKDGYNQYQTVRLVADCGSQRSFITLDCVQRLGLEAKPCSTSVTGIGQLNLPVTQGEVSCTLRSRHNNYHFHTTAIVVHEITGDLPQTKVPISFQNVVGAFDLADPTFWKPQAVEFLLGADLFFDVVTGGPIQIHPSSPKLIPSHFGHIVTGKCQHGGHQPKITSLVTRESPEIQQLHTIMSRFWELEEVKAEVPWSEEELECERHFMTNHYRLESGRYVVALPFRKGIGKLRSPTQQVESRFRRLEYKLENDPGLRIQYNDFIHEYLTLEHMSLAHVPARYLIPHHGIHKEEGDQSKLRVVFDASCKGPQGSLNSHLMVGPKLQRDICSIVLKFRLWKIVFVADVVKMYRQVLLRPEDRHYQHVLWRFNPLEPVCEYQLNTVTYGIASSAFLAIRALQQLAKDEGAEFPRAARVLLEDVYVDDIVSGADTLEEALTLQDQLVNLLHRGCFELSKWKSNHKALLDSVACEQPEGFFTLEPSEDYTGCKILGLQWIPASDSFTFQVKQPSSQSTKRGILSTIARIFDPLGFLAPVVFEAKVILQEVWRSCLAWDDTLPEGIRSRWQNFSERLPDLQSVKIQRHLPTTSGSNFILGFADASERGYAAVLYLHNKQPETHQTYILKAKTKVAPAKLTSIPRLELCGALLLSRLVQSCSDLIGHIKPERILLFTDSTVVLGWLSISPSRLKSFVAHRVAEIVELTNHSSWQHIDSASNPADCASRGLMPNQLSAHNLWWSGPSWLSLSTSEWPCSRLEPPSESLPELKPLNITCLISSKSTTILEWVNKSSSYLKVLRSLAWCLRFIQRVKGESASKGFITLSELQKANITCIRLVQKEHLPSLQTMQTSKPWKFLSPFKDCRGLFRVGGRLQNAEVSYTIKHPLILPKCHFTRLLIAHYHNSFLHIGSTSMQSMIQTRYYIISARKLIRSCIRQCVSCQRSMPKVQSPFMGSLPAYRLKECRVFQNVGVDLGGPFPLKESKRRNSGLGKGYLCLFICMVTKALHLEVVSSCSTEAFLAALNRFISRRGKPLNIYSDHGSNFRGAASALNDLRNWYRSKETQSKISVYAAERDIEWHMIPPRAPHFGGLWEAGIKSAKSLLTRNLKSTPLTFEELSTIFCRIEAILNSRPLCPISEDVDVIECLTPGHFLIGRALTALPEKSLTELKENTLSRWQLIQQRVQHFWSRWRLEYLNQLQQRRKWTTSGPNLTQGDLVILKEENVPPASWPLARVVDTHPGSDEVVRVATVRTSNRLYKRPVVKLIPLRLPSQ